MLFTSLVHFLHCEIVAHFCWILYVVIYTVIHASYANLYVAKILCHIFAFLFDYRTRAAAACANNKGYLFIHVDSSYYKVYKQGGYRELINWSFIGSIHHHHLFQLRRTPTHSGFDFRRATRSEFPLPTTCAQINTQWEKNRWTDGVVANHFLSRILSFEQLFRSQQKWHKCTVLDHRPFLHCMECCYSATSSIHRVVCIQRIYYWVFVLCNIHWIVSRMKWSWTFEIYDCQRDLFLKKLSPHIYLRELRLLLLTLMTIFGGKTTMIALTTCLQ